MKLIVTMPSVFREGLEASQSETIAELKQRICKKYSLENQLTTLLLNGRQLKEKQKVSEIPQNSTIIVDYLWSRNLITWGFIGQKILRESTIFLAGAGAFGNEVAKNLAMIGVGRLLIADFDKIETSNLNRTVFFDKTDLERPKAEALAEKIHSIYPFVKAQAYNDRIENLPYKVFLDSDLIISGLDNLVSRIFLTSIARRYLIPLIDGGMIGPQGRVQTYIPPDSPCPICPLPKIDYDEISGLRNPCSDPIDQASITALPAFPTSTSIVSAIQAQEAVKILFKQPQIAEKKGGKVGDPLEGVLIIDLKYNRYSVLPLKRNPKCIVCGRDGIAQDTVQRITLPLKNKHATIRLHQRIRRKLGRNIEELRLFIEDPVFKEISKEEDLKIQSLSKTNYIHVLFKKEKEEYREALVNIRR